MLQLDYDIVVFLEGKAYVAYCPELDVSSCGSDVDEAKKNLKTAVRLFLEETEKMGSLDQILQEAGYVPDNKGGYLSPRLVATENVSVAVGR